MATRASHSSTRSACNPCCEIKGRVYTAAQKARSCLTCRPISSRGNLSRPIVASQVVQAYTAFREPPQHLRRCRACVCERPVRQFYASAQSPGSTERNFEAAQHLELPSFDVEHKHVNRSHAASGKKYVRALHRDIDRAIRLMRSRKRRVTGHARLIERCR